MRKGNGGCIVVRVEFMLLALIPLFDENMTVKAYSVFSQKENFLLNPRLLGTAQYDGATTVEGLELIESMGIDTISDDTVMHLMRGSYF